MKKAENKDIIQTYGLEEQDGLWYYKGRLYVPSEEIRKKILYDRHDSKVAGHFGIRKTLRAVGRDFWWPGLTTMIKQYVLGCPACGQNKDSKKYPST